MRIYLIILEKIKKPCLSLLQKPSLKYIYRIIDKYSIPIYIFFCVLISLILALRPIPWAVDDQNYLNYVRNGSILLEQTLQNTLNNPFVFFVNEPIWLFINGLLGVIVSPEYGVRIIIFVSSLFVLYSLGKITKFSLWTIFFFIFLDQIVKNHILHLRQGLALGVYLFGYTKKGKLGYFIRIISLFIHTSIYFVFFCELYERIFKKIKLTSTRRLVIFSVFVTLIIIFLPYIVLLTGDRRIGIYSFSMSDSASSLGFLWWLIVGGLFFIGTEKGLHSMISTYGIIFYLSSYYFLDFGARVFENFLPLIVSVMITSKDSKYLYIPIMTIYGLLNWFSRGGLTL